MGGFQSISSWKVLWKCLPTSWPAKQPECFNPSLHGRYSGSAVFSLFLQPLPGVSIHLFMEGTLEALDNIDVLGVDFSFNPSLHGRYSGSFSDAADTLLVGVSFNPSLHGRYSGSSRAGCVFITVNSVSIHLFMEGTLEGPCPRSKPSSCVSVSIHLFMEGTLEARSLQHQPQSPSCFNPSLHGRYSGSRRGFQVLYNHRGSRILLLLIIYFTVRQRAGQTPIVSYFPNAKVAGFQLIKSDF